MRSENAYLPELSKRAKKAFDMSFITHRKPWGSELSFVLPVKDCASEITLLRKLKTSNKVFVRDFGRENEILSRIVMVNKMRLKPTVKIVIRTSIRQRSGVKRTK